MTTLDLAKLIPWIPGLAALVCGLGAVDDRLRKAAGWVCVGSIFLSFVLTVGIFSAAVGDLSGGKAHGDHHAAADPALTLVADPAEAPVTDGHPHGEDVHGDTAPGLVSHTVTAFPWIRVGNLQADVAFFIDPLTIIMMLVITGIGGLIALYATGYMAHDPGEARFFMGVSLFVCSMLLLVMADNLLLLYLGWEGVGLCSYLLIGHYFKHPVAVDAAKKAFVVNRIGDLGFALGIALIYYEMGSVRFDDILPQAQQMLEGTREIPPGLIYAPFLIMLGAFGKSAQLPLYVWLPDAMAGPTPVSALVHAATMVTAGVYLIARMTPIFQLAPGALELVAVVGAITALYAATIAMSSNDLKGVFAYSTISQLGYMFVGVAILSVGGVFHLVTHAFFKALLFLTAGSVMHALAGSLDIRTMSGLGHKMPVTKWLMFFGCLALSGFPFSAGFYSKDLILGDAVALGLVGPEYWWAMFAGLMGLAAAFLTAFYTFRLWFRVFTGPEQFVMGRGQGEDAREPLSDLEAAMIDVAEEEAREIEAHGGHHATEPHEMPAWPMNFPLVILALGAALGGFLLHKVGPHYIDAMLLRSTQFMAAPKPPHTYLLGLDAHTAVALISGVIALSGIGLAFLLFSLNRGLGQALGAATRPLGYVFEHGYFIDTAYRKLIVTPLRFAAYLMAAFDQLVIDWCVRLVGLLPVGVGLAIRKSQTGHLQGYGIFMVAGIAVLAAVVFFFAPR
ncbi:MAG: NADH-quinone oxidoreductase subunit L [Planctomycetota bacterium]